MNFKIRSISEIHFLLIRSLSLSLSSSFVSLSIYLSLPFSFPPFLSTFFHSLTFLSFSLSPGQSNSHSQDLHMTWLTLCVTLTKVPPINKGQEEAAFLGSLLLSLSLSWMRSEERGEEKGPSITGLMQVWRKPIHSSKKQRIVRKRMRGREKRGESFWREVQEKRGESQQKSRRNGWNGCERDSDRERESEWKRERSDDRKTVKEGHISN